MKVKPLIILTSLSIFLVACTPATPEAEVMEETPEVTQSMEIEPTEMQVAVADYQVDMSNFAYSVTEMEAQPGQTLTLNLTVVEGMHDLVIDELDFQSAQLQEGESQTVEITIPEDAQPGDEYEYYCSVGNHRQMGMVGTLTVVE